MVVRTLATALISLLVVLSSAHGFDLGRERHPLEAFEREMLRYIAYEDTPHGPVALVLSPGGEVHRVVRGNYVGKNYGYVVAIDANEIRVVELYPDGAGGWLERSANMPMVPPSPQEESPR